MEEDEELKRIRRRMLKRLKKRAEEEKGVKLAPSEPVTVTDSNLNETIHNYPMVVIDCWAPWCAPCHMVAPVIEGMAKEYAGRILFGKLNVDENRLSATNYQIMGIPQLLVFKNGKLVDRIVGAMPWKVLEQRITHRLR